MLDGLAAEHGTRLPFRATTDLVDAVEGADFVFSAIRVGQLEGRVIDEDVPLGLGVLGQETTGPGGICFALRTIPVMVRLAETIAQHAPNAWLINFTNPAGMVTEAVQQVLGDRAVGICDSPRALPAGRAGGRARRGRAVVRLLRAQPPRLAARRARRRRRAAARRPARGRRAADELRGGPAVRRRVAALARDDPERVPLLLLLRGRHGQRDPRQRRARAGTSCSSSSARSTRERAGRARRAGRVARHPPRPRAHVHGRGPHRRR